MPFKSPRGQWVKVHTFIIPMLYVIHVWCYCGQRYIGVGRITCITLFYNCLIPWVTKDQQTTETETISKKIETHYDIGDKIIIESYDWFYTHIYYFRAISYNSVWMISNGHGGLKIIWHVTFPCIYKQRINEWIWYMFHSIQSLYALAISQVHILQ